MSQSLEQISGWRDADALRKQYDDRYQELLQLEDLQRAKAEYQKQFPLWNKKAELTSAKAKIEEDLSWIKHRRNKWTNIGCIAGGIVWFGLGIWINVLSEWFVFSLFFNYIPAILLIRAGIVGFLPLNEDQGRVDLMNQRIEMINADLSEIETYLSFDEWYKLRNSQDIDVSKENLS
jgi:hypothetical protein